MLVLIALLYPLAVTPALCVYDATERRLPNAIVLPGYVPAVGVALAQWVSTGIPPWLALASGATYFGFMLLLALIGGMGMGDVKLAGLLGITAGTVGVAAAVLSPVTAFLLGGIVSLVVLLRRGRGARIPFGPFMLAGFWVAVLLDLSRGGSST